MVLVSLFYHHREEMSLSFWFPFGICSFIVYNEEIGYHLLKKAYGADGAFVEYAYTNTDRMSFLPYRNLHIFGVKWLI